MGEVEEQRYVCRICSKTCVSGKSLGGHMRAHLSSKKSDVSSSCVEEFGDGDAANSCRECGKEFASTRALSGHMRCHSVKNKKGVHLCKECGRGFESMRAVFGHMKSHSSKRVVKVASVVAFENFCPVRRKRSKIKYDGAVSVSVDPSELEEAEEAARCLVMLSRGVGGFSKLGSDYDGDSDYFGGVVASCGSGEGIVANVSEFDDAEMLEVEKGMEVDLDLDLVCDEGVLKDGNGSNGGDDETCEKGADLEVVEGLEEEEEKHRSMSSDLHTNDRLLGGGEEGRVEQEMGSGGSARGSLRGGVSMRRCSSLLEMDAVAVIW